MEETQFRSLSKALHPTPPYSFFDNTVTKVAFSKPKIAILTNGMIMQCNQVAKKLVHHTSAVNYKFFNLAKVQMANWCSSAKFTVEIIKSITSLPLTIKLSWVSVRQLFRYNMKTFLFQASGMFKIPNFPKWENQVKIPKIPIFLT